MKKNVILIIAGILLVLMSVSNIKESDFLNIINNSSDPLSEFYMDRLFKNAKPIIIGKDYFYGLFEIDYNNYIIFSYVNIKSGWGGTLNIQGIKQGKFIEKITEKKYFLVFGNYYKV